jgi:peptidoglycan LD-endopeptidase CwlK
MARFSKKSQARLDSCHKDLERVFDKVLENGRWDCSILEGYRSPERQNELFRQKLSEVSGGNSKHNYLPSLAVDVAPYPIDWKNLERFRRFGEYVLGVADSLGIKLRWGGDWDGDTDIKDQKFNDLVHFELRT